MILRILISFGFALKGILHCARKERNFIAELFIAIVVLSAGIYWRLSKYEWICIICCIAFVLVAEMFNSSIELLCNIVSPEYDQRIGKIKDIAAGSVLLAAACSLTCGCIIFLPKIFF